MKEYDEDIRIAARKLKAPRHQIEHYKKRYKLGFADTPESLDVLSVTLYVRKYQNSLKS